jgi:tRNA dimethylallyltransferase
MVEGGLIEEVNRLRARGFSSDVLTMQALGYAQVAAYVDGGMTLQEALDTLQRQTRRFAKHQMTWFRGMGEVEWFDVPPQGLEALRGQLLRRIDVYLSSRGATV